MNFWMHVGGSHGDSGYERVIREETEYGQEQGKCGEYAGKIPEYEAGSAHGPGCQK